MLRDKSLIPLSHQHQRALALCVRIDRAQPIPATDLESWQAEIEQHFEQEIRDPFLCRRTSAVPGCTPVPRINPAGGRTNRRSCLAPRIVFAGKSAHHVRRKLACFRATTLRSHPQRRTPTLRTSAAVDERKRSSSSRGSPGRSSQRRRAVLHPAEPGNEAAAKRIAARNHNPWRVLNCIAASRPM